MNCPLCDRTLERTTLLPAGPASHDLRCPGGHGVFLPSDLYYDWRDRGGPAAPDGARRPAAPEEVGDVKRAKLCPQDGRIMGRYRVGAAGAVWGDPCGACGGAGFDGREWEATVAAGLVARLPDVFTDAWERAEVEAADAAARRGRVAAAVGEADLERVDAFRAWMWDHPQRHLLLAWVNERPPGDGEPGEPAA